MIKEILRRFLALTLAVVLAALAVPAEGLLVSAGGTEETPYVLDGVDLEGLEASVSKIAGETGTSYDAGKMGWSAGDDGASAVGFVYTYTYGCATQSETITLRLMNTYEVPATVSFTAYCRPSTFDGSVSVNGVDKESKGAKESYFKTLAPGEYAEVEATARNVNLEQTGGVYIYVTDIAVTVDEQYIFPGEELSVERTQATYGEDYETVITGDGGVDPALTVRWRRSGTEDEWTEEKPTDAGTYDAQLLRPGDSQYIPWKKTVENALQIDPLPVIIAWSGGPEFYYESGEIRSVTAGIFNRVGQDEAEPVLSGSEAEEIGDYTAVVTGLEGADCGNYTLEGSDTLSYEWKIVFDDVHLPRPTPEAAIDYREEKLTGLIADETYRINGVSYTADASGCIALEEGWLGGTLAVVLPKDSEETRDSAPQLLAVPARPDPPAGLGTVKSSDASAGDGKITGVTAAMEYRVNDSDSGWIQCTEGELSGLASGEYLVRYMAGDQNFAGPAVSVSVGFAVYSVSLSGDGDFGTVCPGYQSGNPAVQQRTVTVTNTGETTISGLSVSLEGTDAFILDQTGLTGVLEAGQSASFTVWPVSTLAQGSYGGEITVRADHGVSGSLALAFTVSEHSWQSDYTVTQEATCTEDGSRFTCCALCGAEKEAEVIPALGHSFTNYVSDGNASCTQDGTKTAKCDRCDATDTQTDTGSALGHSFTSYVSNNNASCTADGTKTAKCDRCDVTDTQTDTGSALGHSFTNYVSNNDASCTADGTQTAKCDRCNVTDTQTITGSAHGHSWSEWETASSGECGGESWEQRSCLVCGLTETQNFVTEGHSWEADYTVDQEAACTQNGSRSIHCGVCGAKKDSEVIPALGHSYSGYSSNGDGTCMEAGTETGYCGRCGAADTRTAGEPVGHSYGEYTFHDDASCTKNGTETASCIWCGVTDTREAEGTALGHSYGEYTFNNDASCTKNGTETAACTRCGVMDTKEAAGTALGHSYGEYTFNNDASCTVDGTETAVCIRCGGTDTRTAAGTAAHQEIVSVEPKSPTETENGNIAYWYCSICGKYYGDAALTQEIRQEDTILKATGGTGQTEETEKTGGTENSGEIGKTEETEAAAGAGGQDDTKETAVTEEQDDTKETAVTEEQEETKETAVTEEQDEETSVGADSEAETKQQDETEESDGDGAAALTGDESDLLGWIAALLVSWIVLMEGLARRKRRS